jgi:deoxyribodipyrimidine photo-lyase
MYKKTLFIFRRDLRLDDNTGLISALAESKLVIPCFIFTPEQIKNNPFKNDRCIQFMVESLKDLSIQLKEKEGKLYLFKGKPEDIVNTCIKKLEIDAVMVNRDYTPYSIQRDEKLEKLCKKQGVFFQSFDDALLNPPEETLKKDQTPYTIFTPYFKNAIKNTVQEPIKNKATNYFKGAIEFAEKSSILSHKFSENQMIGGRSEALKILKKMKSFKSYEKLKDFPSEIGSSNLSPYLKFTVCSPREVYKAIEDSLGAEHGLIRALYWRDFFTTIAFFFPQVFKGSFRPQFDSIKWSSNKKNFEKWCNGTTGFPIVDAGMRELNQTGLMHNRVRMIAGSFLVKDLHIDWHWGEKYFAQTLIDYDPSVNNGNWQWVASTGCDAQPYFRIFNPWNQQKKFDPDCIYIKQWIPELKKASSLIIHNWYKEDSVCKDFEYPMPMLDHTLEAKKALKDYRSVKK